MSSRTAAILGAFARQLTGVDELLDFDRFVLDHAVTLLGEVAHGLEEGGRHRQATAVRNRLAAIQNIRSADSLRPRYETIFNQCIVLLVSYFGSTVNDLFKTAVAASLASGDDVPVVDRAVEVTWRRLGRSDVSVPDLLAEAFVDQQKISFQDMQSIVRAFRENLGIEIQKTEMMHDIILGQAARHVIVHAAGRVDERMLSQLRNAVPRRLKPALALGETVQFAPDEIRLMAESMRGYVDALVSAIGRLGTHGEPSQPVSPIP